MNDATRPSSNSLPSDDADVATRVISGLPPVQGAAVEPLAPFASTELAPPPSQAAPAPAPARVTTPAGEAGVLPPGCRMAEFEITSLIGQGGFGAVYEAWDHTLERTVAIKEYLPTSLSTRANDGTVTPLSEKHRDTFDLGMRSFINEARLLAQFDHPSLLKVYRFWEENGTTYMVMPLYRGKTLRQTLNEQSQVDEDWLLRIMDGVTQALAVMHNANCYHRDIAPDNILLLEGSGKPVVLDFGAARRVITDKTQAITVILKPGYAPVEQYAEMPDMTQGAWTDVYALAAVMHVAVCGRPPPPSVARIMSDSYVPLASNELLKKRYSLKLLQAIDVGLAVRPENRPQSMQALRGLLGLEDSTTIAPLHPAASRAAPQAVAGGVVKAQPRQGAADGEARSGRPVMGLLAGALALVVLGGGAWWWMQGRLPAGDSAVVGGGPVAVTAPASGSEPVAAVPTPPPPPLPAAPPPVPRTPLESLQALGALATPGFTVQAKPAKAEVVIGKDPLSFEVRSNRDGFVYVYLLSSGGEMFMLFPNLLDRHNRITANTPLSLPRASWPMNAGGPAGANQFAVVVSQHERDYGEAGMLTDGVFPQFPLSVLAALESVQAGQGPTPLLGKPQCPAGGGCTDVYGVANFKIIER